VEAVEPLTADAALVPRPPPQTGQATVDAALAGLAVLDDIPVQEHPARLAQAHETLRALLRSEPGPVSGPPAGP
jgi:hypothetical protein